MGMLVGGFFSAGGIVVLTGYASSRENPGGLVHSGIAFQRDGTIDDVGPGALERTQVNAGEWFSKEPQVAIGDNYDIRCATISGGPWSTQAATVGTYIKIDDERRWSVRVLAMDSPITLSCTGIPFEIRLTGGGSVLAAANHSGEAIN